MQNQGWSRVAGYFMQKQRPHRPKETWICSICCKLIDVFQSRISFSVLEYYLLSLCYPSHLLLSQSCLLWLILINIRERQEECPERLGLNEKDGIGGLLGIT